MRTFIEVTKAAVFKTGPVLAIDAKTGKTISRRPHETTGYHSPFSLVSAIARFGCE